MVKYEETIKYIDNNKYLIDLIILNQSNWYKTFYIKKNNGKYRRIDEPKNELKKIQKWILRNLLEDLSISDNANAYIKNRTILDNAKVHLGKEYIFKIDLKNFFQSIKYDIVFDLFIQFGFDIEYSKIISKLVTYRGSLPQGAPTSPCISNLIFKNIDEEINDYISRFNINYTRYADDMIFSGNIEIKYIYTFVKKILFDNEFKINSNKTKLISSNHRQTVTGIVVNNKLQVDKLKRKKVRQELYFIKMYGINNHLLKMGLRCSPISYIDKLIGRIGFMHYVNTNDKELKKYLNELMEIKNAL